MTDELRDWTRDAIDATYGGDEPELENDPADESPEDESAEDASTEATDEEATAFYDAMSPDQLERATVDEAYRDELWSAWLEGEGEGGDALPTSGADVVALILADGDDLEDEDGNPITPAEWLRWASSADPRAWARACAEAGWPPSTAQPSPADVRAFGRGVEGSVQAADWEALLARRARDGRYLGS